MKKALSIFISICFFVNFSYMPIYADEVNDEYYISDIEVLEIEEDGLKHAFSFYSKADQKSYLVKGYDNKSIIIDLETNTILSDLVVTQEHEDGFKEKNKQIFNILPLATPDDYEVWGDYAYYQTSSLYIGDVESKTISVIVGLITGYFGVGFLKDITELAIKVYNNKYEGLDAKIYNSSNVYCPILIKQRYDFYPDGNTTNLLYTDYKAPTFWGSPIDFSQPYACRVLDERY